jgi:molybdopterin converting factor small subunit
MNLRVLCGQKKKRENRIHDHFENPNPFASIHERKNEVNVNGANISEALNDLTIQFPNIKPHLFNEGGELRPFVNIFIGENNIKDLQGVETPIKDGEKLMLIPSKENCAD